MAHLLAVPLTASAVRRQRCRPRGHNGGGCGGGRAPRTPPSPRSRPGSKASQGGICRLAAQARRPFRRIAGHYQPGVLPVIDPNLCGKKATTTRWSEPARSSVERSTRQPCNAYQLRGHRRPCPGPVGALPLPVYTAAPRSAAACKRAPRARRERAACRSHHPGRAESAATPDAHESCTCFHAHSCYAPRSLLQVPPATSRRGASEPAGPRSERRKLDDITPADAGPAGRGATIP